MRPGRLYYLTFNAGLNGHEQWALANGHWAQIKSKEHFLVKVVALLIYLYELWP